jgi:chitin synthase
MLVSQIIVLIITSISFIDFLVFCGLFLTYIIKIPFGNENVSTKIMAGLIIFFFISFKLMHIPVFLSSVKPSFFDIPYSDIMIAILTYINIALAIVPLFFAIYAGLKPTPNVKSFNFQDQIFICMPIYNETPEDLYAAILSVINANYNKYKLHLYLSFDHGPEETPDAFEFIMDKWNLEINSNPCITIDLEGIRVSILRTKHAGKKSAQKSAFDQITLDYPLSIREVSKIFFIDSDIVLEENCINHFLFHMKAYNKTCVTGMLTCSITNRFDFLSMYQDIEYISGQILSRNLENTLNSSLVLPGALSFLNYTSFSNISHIYFEDHDYKDVIEYHRKYLGEDRNLTHNLIENGENISFCQFATCRTVAPDTFYGLLKQRRRWYLGHISNDIYSMCSVYIWTKYPGLSLFNFLNNIRNTSIYIYILYFILLFDNNTELLLWLLMIILPISLLWIFISCYAIRINRKMNIIFYPIILILQPIFSMIYMYYTIYTFNVSGWGGVRTENEKVDKKGDNSNKV